VTLVADADILILNGGGLTKSAATKHFINR